MTSTKYSDINGPIEAEETAGILTSYVPHFYGNLCVWTITHDYRDGYPCIVEHQTSDLEVLTAEALFMDGYGEV